jgi:hypothetical protein
MSTYYRALAVLTVLCSASGCAVQQGGEQGDQKVGAVESELLTANLLTANLLTANLLTANLLTANLLTANALASSSLAGPVQAALQDPALGANDRTLFHYIATCALDSTQSITYTWSDADGPHTVTEAGQVGLARSWATGPLNLQGQELVSGCVAARVNHFGVSVHLSARALVPYLLANTTDAELEAYPYVEGAFWGNMFSPTQSLYACYDTENAAHSLAAQRACATGYVDESGVLQGCGPIALTGSCSRQCAGFDSDNQLYVNCGGTHDALTIALQ